MYREGDRVMVQLRGEDTATGLRDWIKTEIRESPRLSYDLGKFFFAVSSWTIGALAALEKLNTKSVIDTPLVLSLCVLFLSIIVALNLARPKKIQVGGDTDLLEAYKSQIDKTARQMGAWFLLWVIGAVIGFFAIRV